MSSIVGSGTPSLLSASHNASRGTESYAFFKSMNTRNDFAQCSQDFSTSWHTVNIISEQPRSLLKPHWDSGSSSSPRVCSLSWMILATTFPTVSSKAMPLQLSRLLRSPFFGIGTSKASDQSFGTSPSFHIACTRSSSSSRKSSSQHAALTISGRMPDAPPAFPFLSLPIASVSSSIVGTSASWCLTGLCLAFLISASLNWLWIFKMLVKCLLHRCCCASTVVDGLPSSSTTVASLDGTSPRAYP